MRPFTAQVLDRLILLVATIAMAARQYQVPNKAFWERVAGNGAYLPLALICTIGIFGALTPFQTMAGRGLTDDRIAARNEVLTHFGSILKIAVRAPSPIGIGDLALHIWRVRKSVRNPIHGRLVRVATYRLGNTQATRSFSPSKGVGVVGLCWKSDAEASRNVERMTTLLPTRTEFEHCRDSQGPDAVMGLSWTEFRRICHRGAVFAAPIRNGAGTFVGCVSVDARTGYANLAVPEFWHEVNSLAQTLGKGGLRNI